MRKNCGKSFSAAKSGRVFDINKFYILRIKLKIDIIEIWVLPYNGRRLALLQRDCDPLIT